MADENETSAAPDETTIVAVVPVTPDDHSADNGELASINARLEAIEAWQIAHSETHIAELETELDEQEETSDDDRTDNDGASEPERGRDPEEEGPAAEVIDRPIRRGLGGFLFGPVRRRR